MHNRLDRLASASRHLDQRPDALGAQGHLLLVPALKDAHLLQVGLELATGGFLRPRAITAKGRVLSTMLTLRHFQNPFFHQKRLLAASAWQVDPGPGMVKPGDPGRSQPGNHTTPCLAEQASIFERMQVT
jgi:hypothetical protein